MSLRTKMSLGMLAIPGIVAVVLVALIVLGVRHEASRLAEAHQSNETNLATYHNELSEELNEAWLLVTRNWIDGNLSVHRHREDRFDEVLRRLRGAAIFRTVGVVQVSQSDWSAAAGRLQVVKQDGKPRTAFHDRALSIEEQSMFNLLKERMAVAHDNVIYRRFYFFDAERAQPTLDLAPDLLLRLEMVAAPRTPPSPALVQLELDSILEGALWTIFAGAFAMALVVTLTIRRIIMRPLDELIVGSRRVASGDYSQPVQEHSGNDEIAELLRAFNTMLGRIQDYQLEMESRVLDATDQIREQERSLIVAQRLAATGTLAAGLAHEINNPLGGMINALRRVRDKSEDPRTLEYLDLIDDGLGRIRTLMGQILNFSRGRDAKPSEFDLGEAIRKAADFVRYRFDERYRLELHIAEDLPKVFGDASSIGQVMINLMLNGRDALAEQTEGEVRVDVRRSGDDVLVGISDSGKGMDAETMAHIFDPFFTTKGPGQGTGLGLTIVHTIISNHDATIDVDSEEGRGTTFNIRIPFVKVEGIDGGA